MKLFSFKKKNNKQNSLAQPFCDSIGDNVSGLLAELAEVGFDCTIDDELLKRMLYCNPARMDYYDRYQTIIEEYNAEKNRAEIERIFEELMKLAQDLTQEEKRYIREGFSSDEELSMFDLLFRADLTKKEIETIKQVAVDLLTKVKAKIAELDHWTDKTETKAIVYNLIRDTLFWDLPESYDDESILAYRQEIYQYFYSHYKDAA